MKYKDRGFLPAFEGLSNPQFSCSMSGKKRLN